ncbi:MAG: J domain-containing protein, partial [Pseudomonadota bacterium]
EASAKLFESAGFDQELECFTDAATGQGNQSVLETINLGDFFNLGETLHFRRTYGDIYKLFMTPEERETYGKLDPDSVEDRGINGVNLIQLHDVLARVPAKDYFQVFSRRDSQQAHKWVITEDGRLIVAPTIAKPEVGDDRSPYTMTFQQLSFGRKVYAAGDLHIDEAGRIHVRLSSFELQEGSSYWDSSLFSFGYSGNDYVAAFVNEIFRVQAGVNVFTVNEGEPIALNSLAKRQGEHETVFGFSPTDDFFEFDVGFDEFAFFADSADFTGFFGSASEDSASVKVLKWDTDADPQPMSRDDWEREVGASSTGDINYSFYVLGVERSDSLETVKSRYRQLAKQFHPDQNSEDTAEDAFKAINNAWEVVKGMYGL